MLGATCYACRRVPCRVSWLVMAGWPWFQWPWSVAVVVVVVVMVGGSGFLGRVFGRVSRSRARVLRALRAPCSY